MTFTRDHLFIGGRWVEPEGGVTDLVINPAAKEVIGSAPRASVKDTALAVAAARKAFDEGPWSRATPGQRGDYLRRLGQAQERRQAELAEIMIAKTGIVGQYADRINMQPPIEMCYEKADRLLPAFSFGDPLNPYSGPSTLGAAQFSQGPSGP
jgi:acyl-CoA reductase-like NAD-dependent aldehyde dehydrogenase